MVDYPLPIPTRVLLTIYSLVLVLELFKSLLLTPIVANNKKGEAPRPSPFFIGKSLCSISGMGDWGSSL